MPRTSKPLGFIGFPCQNLHSAAAMLTGGLCGCREAPTRCERVFGSASASADDTGDRSASAEMEDLYTIYVTKTLGDNGMYALLGYHDATITTTETLPASKYGNASLNGIQYGIGFKTPVGEDGAIRYELSYSDFDDISLTDSTNSKNVITAEADAYTLKIGFNF